MKKLFHFDSLGGSWQYQCDAAVVWCFDNRFDAGVTKFLKRTGVLRADQIRIAGGAKSLASPVREGDREFVLDHIRASIRLHGTRRVILMLHSDCGGYGGIAAFHDDAAAEAEHHQAELRRAADAVLQAIPGVHVDAYLIDFEGVWEVYSAGFAARRSNGTGQV